MTKQMTSVSFSSLWGQLHSGGGGPMTTFFSQRVASVIAWTFLAVNASPNFVSMVGGGVSLAGALLFAYLPSSSSAAVFCLILLQLGYCLDCADGQVARAAGRATKFGEWVDLSVDFMSQFALAFSILYWLSVSERVLPAYSFIAVAVFVFGRAIVLFTAKYTSKGGRPPFHVGEVAFSFKSILLAVLDTPVVLLVLCLLRGAPLELCVYLLFMGALYFANACYLSFTRLNEDNVPRKVILK